MNPTALLIEDSPTQAKILAFRLEQKGIRAFVAEDGPAGLQAVDMYHPDFILLDINLPSMNGYQVCRRLKRDPRTAHIPVIMLTERDSAAAEDQGFAVGADDYIPKSGFALERLAAVLAGMGIVAEA